MGTYKDNSLLFSEGQEVLEATHKTESLSSDVKFEEKCNRKMLIMISSGLIVLGIIIIFMGGWKKMFTKTTITSLWKK